MLKISTWNVNGIRARKKQLADWLEREKPDVLCLQELKALPDQIPTELCEQSDYVCYWHGLKGYSGVSMQIRSDLLTGEPSFTHPPFDFECRVVEATLGSLSILSVYVPNGGKDFAAKERFLAELESYAAAVIGSGRQLVICGDLNVARDDMDVHPKERKKNGIGQLPGEREQFERLLETGLVDVARKLHPDDDSLYTWWAPWRKLRERNIGWRIDYILASPAVAATATSFRSVREFGSSDHAPLVAEFALPMGAL